MQLLLLLLSRLERQEIQILVKSGFEKLENPSAEEITVNHEAFSELRTHISSIRVYREAFSHSSQNNLKTIATPSTASTSASVTPNGISQVQVRL